MFIDNKPESGTDTLRDMCIVSSVSGAIEHHHEISGIRVYLKQCEKFGWETYLLRFNVLQGEGDDKLAVEERAYSLKVQPHESVRSRRTSGDRRVHASIEMDESEGNGSEDESDESSDNSEESVMPARKLVLRKK